MVHRAALVRTYVWEENFDFIFRVKIIRKLGKFYH
jgi:hypothetical protein